MKNKSTILIPILLALCLSSCQRERYRTDKKNQLSKETKIANDYLAVQAIEMTQENIEKKESRTKASIKRKNKEQAELEALNSKGKTKKGNKRHSGIFYIY
jgi:hypothetical protein